MHRLPYQRLFAVEVALCSWIYADTSNMTHNNEGDTVSLGWVNISSPQHVYNATNTAAAATSPSTAAGNSISWTSDPADAFNGNASVVLETGGGGGGRGKRGGVEVGRVGVGGRGLYHQGFALAAGKEYRGYLAVKSAAAADVTVALEDWDADPSQPPQAATAGNYTVAQTTVHHSGDGRWAVRCPTPASARPPTHTNCPVILFIYMWNWNRRTADSIC